MARPHIFKLRGGNLSFFSNIIWRRLFHVSRCIIYIAAWRGLKGWLHQLYIYMLCMMTLGWDRYFSDIGYPDKLYLAMLFWIFRHLISSNRWLYSSHPVQKVNCDTKAGLYAHHGRVAALYYYCPTRVEVELLGIWLLLSPTLPRQLCSTSQLQHLVCTMQQ